MVRFCQLCNKTGWQLASVEKQGRHDRQIPTFLQPPNEKHVGPIELEELTALCNKLVFLLGNLLLKMRPGWSSDAALETKVKLAYLYQTALLAKLFKETSSHLKSCS